MTKNMVWFWNIRCQRDITYLIFKIMVETLIMIEIQESSSMENYREDY